LRLLIFMCPEKKLTRGPEQYVSLIVAGTAGAAFSNTRWKTVPGSRSCNAKSTFTETETTAEKEQVAISHTNA